MATEFPLVVIVGPTASGKTALALELAERWNGEIICADSRTVYAEMNIGTAKPTNAERARVPHFGLDVVTPDQRYSAAAFQAYASNKIEQIRGRGHVPFLVGGTGLYIDAVIYDYSFPAPPSEQQRIMIQSMNLEELTIYCLKNNIELPTEDKNSRRLQKAILSDSKTNARRSRVIENCIIVGIATEKQVLEQRIVHRTEQMFSDGVVEEAKKLGKKYGWNAEAMTSNVYRSIKQFLDGDRSLDATKADFIIRDRQLAKRQMTWFRRNREIVWLDAKLAATYIDQQLAK